MSTTTAEKHIFFSKVVQRESIEPPGMETYLPIVFYLMKQTLCWYDHPTEFTCETSPAGQRGFAIDFSSREDQIDTFANVISGMGVPRQEQPTILKKISDMFQVAVPWKCVLVLIADVTVQLLGSYGDLGAIDNLIRSSPNVEFRLKYRGFTGTWRWETHTICDVDYHDTTTTDELLLEIDRLTLESFETQWVRFVPATRSSVKSLQKVRLDSLDEATIKLNPSCSICKDDFAEGGVDQLVIPLPCAHHYHVDCIIRWLEMGHVCPLCRYALPTVEDGEPSNS
ncbi:uncharacterized protein LOC133706710 [Rosa rugosa]|uniref:uncharacterized protein LOC133706710 n=1 Tax=Rosa rugosa TaxID=74645 RepID=UPI002B4053FA|nr:uncharacterized protein LOC133706710 [Rosa rugosa]